MIMLSSSLTGIVAFVAANKFATMLILFGALVIEGESFLIIAGVLIHLGALSLWEVIAVALSGAILGDLLWYSVGIFLRKIKRAEKIISWFESIVNRLLPQFKQKPFLSLIMAKYIYGTNHATLILSGVIGMDFWLFARAQSLATVIWVLVFIALGYIFGSAALLVSNKVSVFLLVVLVLTAGFLIAQRALSVYYERKREIK